MKNIFNLAVLTLFAALTACQPMKEADLIIINAKIYTVDDDFSMAEAMAIKDGKILAIGTDKQILKKRIRSTPRRSNDRSREVRSSVPSGEPHLVET